MNTFCPDKAMLQLYIQQKLPPAEEEQVELWLMDYPDVVDDLKLDLAFSQWLKPIPEPAQTSTARGRFFDWFLKPKFAMAGIMILTIGGLIGFFIGTSNFNDNAYTPITNIDRLPLEITRGTNQERPDARIYLNKTVSLTILEIDIEPWIDQYSGYSLEINYADSTTVTLEDPPVKAGVIKVALDSRRIPSDTVIAKLIGISANSDNKVLNEYVIKIIRP